MTTPPDLATARLRLRPFRPGDASSVERLAGDEAVADTTANIPHPYPPGTAAAWIATHEGLAARDREVVLAVTEPAAGLVGAVGLRLDLGHARGELGYWIGRPYWGRGYATEAAAALAGWAFDHLRLHRVNAFHFARNPASGRVLAKIGMRHEGRLREHLRKGEDFEDLEAWGLLAAERPAQPAAYRLAAPRIPARRGRRRHGGALPAAGEAQPDPTARFTGRAAAYARYRPPYPPGLIPLLVAEIGLEPAWAVVDLGCGTGLSAAPFLGFGCAVTGVEPNAAMRQAAAAELAAWPRFTSHDGRAEASGLPGASADLLVAAQAFHWFDRPAARAEMHRLLRPGGWVALLWNTRRTDTPFLAAYEALLHRFAIDYRQVDHRRVDGPAVAAFFAPAPCRRFTLPNELPSDREALFGRTLSCSYVPGPDDPRAAALAAALGRLFDRHQEDGVVRMAYDTEIYAGRLDAP